jgi:hypothetical protein
VRGVASELAARFEGSLLSHCFRRFFGLGVTGLAMVSKSDELYDNEIGEWRG